MRAREERAEATGVYRDFVREQASSLDRDLPEDGVHDYFVLVPVSADIGQSEWELVESETSMLRQDTFEDFCRAQQDECLQSLGPLQAEPLTVEVVNPTELKRVFGEGSRRERWARFHERYPNATLLRVSPVGFSADGLQALVYFHGGASKAYCVLLKDGNGWRTVEAFRAMHLD